MLVPIHEEMTRKALKDIIAPHVLEIVIQANRKLDGIKGQIGHSEYHFDNDQIQESLGYIQDQREIVYLSIKRMDYETSWQAFGRLIHTAQDMYAHSNYVTLWLEQFPERSWPPPSEIEPLDELVLANPKLCSGKLYYPLELLSFIPYIKKIVIPLLPHDSHAWMNLDSPASGEKFPYAFSAAVKRTRAELEIIQNSQDPEAFHRFICASKGGV